jgi:hypothetical protein
MKLPVVWSGNATFGDLVETYFGSNEAPILYVKTHKVTNVTEYYILYKLVYEEDLFS